MLWQNLVFAFVTPLVLMALIALVIVGLGSSLLWVTANAGETAFGHWFGNLLGLHGHDVGKGIAVLVALIYATLILVGAAVVSLRARPGPDRSAH